MPDASLVALLALLVSLATLLVLLFRAPRAAPDPAIPMLQAAQERQSERLGALGGELAAAIARAAEETGRTISGFTAEQTRLLQEGLGRQQDRLAAHGAAQAEADAALRRELDAAVAALRTGLEALRTVQAESEARLRKALSDDMTAARDLIDRKAAEGRAEIEAKLAEMRAANDARLAEIQSTVNEQLHAAVEKQMSASFERVIDQFTQVQKAMGDVAAVTGQIGDLKRLFSNVKTRGGWGEAQARAVLEDILPGGYVENFRPRQDGAEAVEFAVVMPSPGEAKLHLPLDAKFPIEDYERLLAAEEAGETEAVRQARRALGERVRRQAADIAAKYIHPPATTEFAVLYLPSDSLYAEVARVPGLLDEIGRTQRVLVLGPSLLPAMLRTIQLGHYSIALSRNAESVRELLGAARTEMQKIGTVLDKLGTQAGTFGKTIESAKVRTRAIERKLRTVDAARLDRARELLELEGEPDPAEEAE